MRLNPFRKRENLAKKAGKAVKKEIAQIETLATPAERLSAYKALYRKLETIYNDGKPSTTGDEKGFSALMGGFGGLMIGGVACAIVAPYAALPIVAAYFGGGAVSGAIGSAGLYGIIGGRAERKRLRAKYGSLKNARGMYNLEKLVAKKAEKESKAIRSFELDVKLKEQFDAAFRKKEAPAVQPEVSKAEQQVAPATVAETKPATPREQTDFKYLRQVGL
jgi:hypothetical protein